MKQILLKGDGYSGRGVRLELLTAQQIDTIRENAARDLPAADAGASPETRQQVWAASQKRAGIAAMVVSVTERTGFKTASDLRADGVSWKKPTADELHDRPEKYFTPKDLDALGDIFFRLHVANKTEVDDILGEALDVTEA